MTDQSTLKWNIKNVLMRHEGRGRAITARELASLVGSNDRAVRLAIRELIADGVPVASSTENPGGYFMVTSWQEAREYADSIKGRVIEDALRRRDFRRSAALYLKPATQERLL